MVCCVDRKFMCEHLVFFCVPGSMFVSIVVGFFVVSLFLSVFVLFCLCCLVFLSYWLFLVFVLFDSARLLIRLIWSCFTILCV